MPHPRRTKTPAPYATRRTPCRRLIVGLVGGVTLAAALVGCASNPPLVTNRSEPSPAATIPVVPTCPEQLHQNLQTQFGEPAQAMTASELGARLGMSLPGGVACIYTGSSGYVGETAYLAFYPDGNEATVSAITAALVAAGYAQDENARWTKTGNWAVANSYPAGDRLHYGDYFNDAPMVMFEGSLAK